MMICNGVRTQITHFKFLPISPLIFATVQKFALDYFRDQQILTPPCEWGWVLVIPLLGKTLEVEDSPGMVCLIWCRSCVKLSYCVLLSRFALQIVPGSGHAPHQEFPQAVNRHITKFIKGDTQQYTYWGLWWHYVSWLPEEMSYMTKWSSMMKVVSKK